MLYNDNQSVIVDEITSERQNVLTDPKNVDQIEEEKISEEQVDNQR